MIFRLSRIALLGGVALIGGAGLLAVSAVDSRAADLSGGVDYASPDMMSPAPASGWQVWGEAALALEYYREPSYDYHEFDFEGWGKILFKSDSGLNLQFGAFAGHDLTHAISFGSIGTDIFYATEEFAAGIYAGAFGNTDDYSNVYAGLQAAKFFSTVDLGGWVGVESGNQNTEAGTWLIAYLTPNWGIGGAVFWEGNEDYDRYGIGWYSERRIADSQWSIWSDGNFQHYVGMGEFNSWDSRIGVTWAFDPPGTTLQQHNHAMPF